jgi:hypothetical protein
VQKDAKRQASSSDEIAVFQAYVDLINSERETLWARHNALLLANSLIIGALAISPAALWENEWAALAMLGAGLLVSAAWIGLTVLAWSAIRRHAVLAGSFAASPRAPGDRGVHGHVSRARLHAPRLSLGAGEGVKPNGGSAASR